MEYDKLEIAVGKIVSVWEDLELSFEDSGETDLNKFMSGIIGYESGSNKTRLSWLKAVLQDYLSSASDEESELISSIVRKMDLVETAVTNNGLNFVDLNSLEELANMGTALDTILEGKDYNRLYDFIENLSSSLNPYSKGEVRKELSLAEYLTRFGGIEEAYGLEYGIGFRYSIKTEEDNGIILLDITNPNNELNKVNGASKDIVGYWLDPDRCGSSLKRILLLEAWNYERIAGSRGGKGTKVMVNGCGKIFDIKDKSILKYKYGYTLFDDAVMVYLT